MLITTNPELNYNDIPCGKIIFLEKDDSEIEFFSVVKKSLNIVDFLIDDDDFLHLHRFDNTYIYSNPEYESILINELDIITAKKTSKDIFKKSSTISYKYFESDRLYLEYLIISIGRRFKNVVI